MGKIKPKPTSGGSSCATARATPQSRRAEKVELQNLNDRLALYIDRVHYLETENARLTRDLDSVDGSHKTETAEIRKLFETELADTRKALDQIANEKAKLEIDCKRLIEDNNELIKFKDALCDLRKHLECETLARVECENTIQSLREELTFKEQMYGQEIALLRKNEHHSTDQFEAHLQKSLREMREQYENEMAKYREETDRLHAANIKELECEVARAKHSADASLEEATNCRNQNYLLHEKISTLEGHASAHSERVHDLEAMLKNQIHLREEGDKENRRLRDDLAQQLQAYQNLMDVKVSLDLELANYDNLLSAEEERLNRKC